MVDAVRQVALAVAACLAAGPLVPAVAAAGPAPEDVERARELYDNGRTLYEEGSWEGAIIAFERAFELSGDINLLYNISMAYDRLGEYESAIRFLDRYRALAPEAERAKLEHKREILEARLQKQREEQAAAKQVDPPVEDDPPATATPGPDEPKRDRIFGPAAWVLTATAVAGYGVGIGFGASSLMGTRAAQNACADGDGDVLCMDSARDDVGRSRNHAIGADVGFAIGAAATIAVVVIVAVKASRRRKAKRANTAFGPGTVRVRF